MEKNRAAVLLRVFLLVGILFFILNSVFFYIDNLGDFFLLALFIGLIIQFVLGIIILSVRIDKKAYQIFVALIFVGWSILNFLIKYIVPAYKTIAWPLYLVAASIFLIISGFYKYRKMKFGYVIPSLTLFFMGIFFSLFSFNIVKVPFKAVAMVLGPVFIVLIGLFLVLFFLIQQRHREFVVKDEDSGDFDDEELSFPKID